jgi:predicted house-cleaning NTP pyrophosphatase (Maf/HAM1 superfamily)
MRLILASASRGRKMLMEEWGVPFEVLVSDVEEPIDGYDNPRTFVQEVAFSKAKAVAERISDGIIVAADTCPSRYPWVSAQKPILSKALKPWNGSSVRQRSPAR